MSGDQFMKEEREARVKAKEPERKAQSDSKKGDKTVLAELQQQVGNRAVQRLIAQRSGDGAFELDDETADRIEKQRGGGQTLDSAVQKQMGEATGQDFSDVRVHAGPEADLLNHQLGAKAFTTGHDIFFQEGAYQPHTSGGQELLAHELTHVVQQSSGVAGGGSGKMTVNAPGDVFERQADAVARSVTGPAPAAEVQRETATEEEDETVQLQELDEEEEKLP